MALSPLIKAILNAALVGKSFPLTKLPDPSFTIEGIVFKVS